MSDQLTLVAFLRARAGFEDEFLQDLQRLLRQDMELHYMHKVGGGEKDE